MSQIPKYAENDRYLEESKVEAFMNNENKVLGMLSGHDNKRAYQKPVLTVINDLRTLTLSPSPVDSRESGPGSPLGRVFINDGIEDQFERRSSRQTDTSSGGRSGRG